MSSEEGLDTVCIPVYPVRLRSGLQPLMFFHLNLAETGLDILTPVKINCNAPVYKDSRQYNCGNILGRSTYGCDWSGVCRCVFAWCWSSAYQSFVPSVATIDSKSTGTMTRKMQLWKINESFVHSFDQSINHCQYIKEQSQPCHITIDGVWLYVKELFNLSLDMKMKKIKK